MIENVAPSPVVESRFPAPADYATSDARSPVVEFRVLAPVFHAARAPVAHTSPGMDYDGAGEVSVAGGKGSARGVKGFDRAGQGYDGGDPGVEEFIMNSSDESMTSTIALDGLRPAPLLELSPQAEMMRHAGGDSEDYTP